MADSKSSSDSDDLPEYKYKMLDSWKVLSHAAKLDYEDRMRYIHSLCDFAGEEGFESRSARDVASMKWYEEAFCVFLFMFGVPGAGLCFPLSPMIVCVCTCS